MSKRTRRVVKFSCVAVMYTATILTFSHYFAAFWDTVAHDEWWIRIVFNLALIGTGWYLGIGLAELILPMSPEEYREYLRNGTRRDW